MTMLDDFRLLERKIHPEFKLLIEHEMHFPTWRVVARETTLTGLSRFSYVLLADRGFAQ